MGGWVGGGGSARVGWDAGFVGAPCSCKDEVAEEVSPSKKFLLALLYTSHS